LKKTSEQFEQAVGMRLFAGIVADVLSLFAGILQANITLMLLSVLKNIKIVEPEGII